MPAPEGTPATILEMLRVGERQAQELAEELGIDTSAVRRHLEAMRADGLVDARDVVLGPGRPKKLYRLTHVGHEAFPRDYALLLGLVLAKLEASEREPNAESILADVAADLGSPIAGEATNDARLAALVKLYRKLGFEAGLERTPEGTCLVQRNCIVLKTARERPQLLCNCFDEGIMRAALPGAKVTLLGSLATGSATCRHLVTFRAKRT